jgi:branched-chain amino acid transport system permease protein
MSKPVAALLVLVCLAVLAAVPLFGSGYIVYIANLLLVFVVLCLGLHIVIGETGQFALAHAAFYGIGIYTAALVGNVYSLPFPLPIVAGGLVAGVIGVVLGAAALRMRDIYLALATFAFGEAMQWVFLNWTAVTGGPNGLSISPATFFGIAIVNDKDAYPFVAVLAVLMVGVGGFARGGAFNRKYANKIMRLRLLMQFIAVVLIVVFVWLSKHG